MTGRQRWYFGRCVISPHVPQCEKSGKMLEIDDKIISLDLFTECFACDLSACKGACCVEGNAGAPLEEDEVDTLEREYEAYRPYMKPEGVEAVQRQGFMVVDEDGEYTTPLIDDAECAFSFEEGGVTYCAVERAWMEGRTSFRKPVSCHLYPIRVSRFGNGTYGLNYHRWNICYDACVCGERQGIPVFRGVRDALVRRFGEEFYEALEQAYEFVAAEKKSGNL